MPIRIVLLYVSQQYKGPIVGCKGVCDSAANRRAPEWIVNLRVGDNVDCKYEYLYFLFGQVY